jgi:hypothetical protein
VKKRCEKAVQGVCKQLAPTIFRKKIQSFTSITLLTEQPETSPAAVQAHDVP